MEAANELAVLENLSFEQMRAYIRDLIDRDFMKLINLLYRFDVSEEKIRSALEHNQEEDAGTLITYILAERLKQSRDARQQFRRDSDIPGHEKW